MHLKAAARGTARAAVCASRNVLAAQFADGLMQSAALLGQAFEGCCGQQTRRIIRVLTAQLLLCPAQHSGQLTSERHKQALHAGVPDWQSNR